MEKSNEIEFKSLLSLEEYNRLMSKFRGNKTNYQVNHYFDTPRFSIKALGCSLRIREREDEVDGHSFVLTLKKKKGYAMVEYSLNISKETFQEIIETGLLPEGEIKDELSSLINSQQIKNFMSLATLRLFLPYNNGILFIDKSTYLGETDYELEYEAKSYHEGKKEFISLINELAIQYKKSDKKINRAYNTLKKKI